MGLLESIWFAFSGIAFALVFFGGPFCFLGLVIAGAKGYQRAIVWRDAQPSRRMANAQLIAAMIVTLGIGLGLLIGRHAHGEMYMLGVYCEAVMLGAPAAIIGWGFAVRESKHNLQRKGAFVGAVASMSAGLLAIAVFLAPNPLVVALLSIDLIN